MHNPEVQHPDPHYSRIYRFFIKNRIKDQTKGSVLILGPGITLGLAVYMLEIAPSYPALVPSVIGLITSFFAHFAVIAPKKQKRKNIKDEISDLKQSILSMKNSANVVIKEIEKSKRGKNKLADLIIKRSLFRDLKQMLDENPNISGDQLTLESLQNYRSSNTSLSYRR